MERWQQHLVYWGVANASSCLCNYSLSQK